jgi:hypothetical protein
VSKDAFNWIEHTINKEHITAVIRDNILHVEVDLTYTQNAKGKIKTFSSTIHTEECTN